MYFFFFFFFRSFCLCFGDIKYAKYVGETKEAFCFFLNKTAKKDAIGNLTFLVYVISQKQRENQ